MSVAKLTIDLSAIETNWRQLDAISSAETSAVVKANAYGLGIEQVAPRLAAAGARSFFVAVAEEGAALRHTIGRGPKIYVFAGHMAGDTALILDADLIPLLNCIDQMVRHVENLPGHPFGIQLDSGMNRLGMEDAEWRALRDLAMQQHPALVMSHLACADDPTHDMNARQLAEFRAMTDGIEAPRSLAATGGVLMGEAYHFDLTRPGIGLYGGLPYVDARPAVRLELPVIQVREVAMGETVGYGNTWVAPRPSRIATVSGGYADGIIRGSGPNAHLYADDRAVPVVGRISMDLIGVDVTALTRCPDHLELLGPHQSVDTVAGFADTIGYEVLTALGARYDRAYVT
ncbi:MAG: alanine racemase [Pseudomonadota bacterium]